MQYVRTLLNADSSTQQSNQTATTKSKDKKFSVSIQVDDCDIIDFLVDNKVLASIDERFGIIDVQKPAAGSNVSFMCKINKVYSSALYYPVVML